MHDLVTLGEVMLRLAVRPPARFETARALDVEIGGAEANVAAAAARLGLRTAWVSALPDNAWGARVRRELAGHGVDLAGVVTIPGARLGAYYLEYGLPPRPTRVLYDRRDSAFARLEPAAVDWLPLGAARLVHLGGVTAGLGEGGRALVRRARDAARAVSYDVNYRAALWTGGEAGAFLEEMLPSLAHLFIGEGEARQVLGLEGSPEAVLEALVRRLPEGATVALLRGAEGSLAAAGGVLARPRRQHRVEVVDPIGAGDAWVAGFLWAWLAGRGLQAAVDAGAAVAALKCTTWGDIARVSPADVAELEQDGPDVRR